MWDRRVEENIYDCVRNFLLLALLEMSTMISSGLSQVYMGQMLTMIEAKLFQLWTPQTTIFNCCFSENLSNRPSVLR
jgi:hypothetical protein